MQFTDTVAVVIPAYNEAENIGHVLESLPDEVLGVTLKAIVIDDGSSDDTLEQARRAGATAVHLPLNRGGGAAVRTGYRLALQTGACVVVTMDADGQHQPSDLPGLVVPDPRRRRRRRQRLARSRGRRSEPRGQRARDPGLLGRHVGPDYAVA